MNYKEFSSKIKSKYPDYSDMDDLELAKKMVSKFPEYDDITFDEAQTQKEPSQETQPEPEKYTRQWIGPQIEKRKQEGYEAFAKGDNSAALTTPIKMLGDIAGTVTGTVSRAFEPATKPIGEAISKITPEPIKKGLGKALGYGVEQYRKIVPEESRELVGSMGNIAGATTLANPFKSEIAALGNKAISAPLETTGKALQLPDKLAGKLAQETSGVSEEALRMATTKTGREALKSASGKQYEIGENLVDAIDNAWDVIPKSAEIKATLQNVPYVNISPLLSKLRTSVPSSHTAEMKGVIEKLNQKADELSELAIKYGDTGNVPADKLFEYRQELDNVIGDSWGKESGKYVSALKETRKDIKDALLQTAKGTEYESQMQDMAKKLDALDKIKQVVGKTSDTREARAESIIRNINNLGKEKKREWLKDFESVFGGDYLNQAKMAQLAEQMGNGGEGAWLPRWTTGRSVLAKGTGLALGSPRIASQVTLPTTQTVGGLGKKIESLAQPFKNK